MDHETLQETPGGRGALVLEKTGRGASRTARDAERRTIVEIIFPHAPASESLRDALRYRFAPRRAFKIGR
ncbi:DUF1534 domain-containing protein, partial [Pseudomonas syringae pv. actinidiae]|nr:DUF1534 domain-containing protein [Pseudomonas syringae pv. actinidiae]